MSTARKRYPSDLTAAPTDWDGAVEVFKRVRKATPRLAKVWADSNYQATALAEWIAANARWVLDIVLKRSGQTTFEVQKWRWVVERTFGWFGRYRRLSNGLRAQPQEQRGVDLHRHDPPHVPLRPPR